MMKRLNRTQYGANTGIVPRPLKIEKEEPSFKMVVKKYPKPTDPTRKKLIYM